MVTQARLLECGSFPLRTYLAEADLDLVLLHKAQLSSECGLQSQIDAALLRVNQQLCNHVLNQSAPVMSQTGAPCSEGLSIRSVGFLNARTKTVTCIIASLSVDITGKRYMETSFAL